ncbi:MAG: TolC family protein [Prevotellaceae bacterium]|jgi:outer membrane protein TolC|nr:TolC family protein [Prevotellaceae bacterium]
MKKINGLKRKVIGLVTVFCVCSSGLAQLTIEDCYAKARANYPLINQYGLIERAKDFNLSNAGKAYLPQVQLSAKASYQSDVTEIPFDFSKLGIPDMSVPHLSNDQYGATVDVSQTVWDGGTVRAKRESIRAKSEVEQKELDVSLYAVNERINQLFFGILLCDALMEQNRLYQDELQRNYEKISSYIKNGVANQADLDAVKVEQLKAKQALTQVVHNRKAFVEMMSAFVGEKFDENIILQKPEISLSPFSELRRPELELFDNQYKTLDAARNEINASLMPKFGLFLIGGYGKPGLNMLENKFSAYYVGGIRLSWNIGSFYTKKNSLSLIESNRNTVKIQRETFVFNTLLNKTGEENEIAKYRELLQSDDEIIALRNSVKRSAEAKLAGGTLNAIDLMREITAEQLAKQDKIVHEIKLTQAIYNLKFITNN